MVWDDLYGPSNGLEYEFRSESPPGHDPAHKMTGETPCKMGNWGLLFTAPVGLSTNAVLTFALVVNEGEFGSAADGVSVTGQASVNQPPVASAGADQVVDEGVLVQLDGSGSSDPEGEAVTCSWSESGWRWLTER